MPRKAPPDTRWTIPIFAGLFLLSALITLAILLSSKARQAGSADLSGPAGTSRPDGSANSADLDLADDVPPGAEYQAESSLSGTPWPGVYTVSRRDFLLEEEAYSQGAEFYPLRERTERWSDEQIKRYWIPPETVGLEIVKRENDRRIREIFKDIP